MAQGVEFDSRTHVKKKKKQTDKFPGRRFLGRKRQVTSVQLEIQIPREALLSVIAPPVLYPKGTKHCLEPSSGFFF